MHNQEVYLPKEDTYLLELVLKKLNLKNKKVLEIGTGSGYLAIFCAKKGAKVTATDINPNVIEYAKKQAQNQKLKIEFIESDLFTKVKDKYDIIFFNPPYLVSDTIKDVAIDGGKNGREVIDGFLQGFDKHLNEKGIIFLLHTDYNNLSLTRKKLKKKGFSFEIVAKEHLFFEELYLLRIFKTRW